MVTGILYALLLTTTVLFHNLPIFVVAKELVYYVDFERANVTEYNPKYFAVVKLNAQRKNRRDPLHYVQLMFETVVPFDKSIKIDVFVYEFLSNEYRRSFVEMHFNICEFFFKDKFIGSIFKQQLHIENCPLPVKKYFFKDLFLPTLPLLRTFPFRKGRVFVNVSNDVGEMVGRAHIDAAIETRFV